MVTPSMLDRPVLAISVVATPVLRSKAFTGALFPQKTTTRRSAAASQTIPFGVPAVLVTKVVWELLATSTL